jgi:FMN reductase
MAHIVTISGSPSDSSRTLLLAKHINRRLIAAGFTVDLIEVRGLPAQDLLSARADAPGIRAAVELVAGAQGIVVASPIYKAAYSGVLKCFLDLLPQFALANKTVLPVATGGSPAHVLAIDYGLRPVLASLGARHVTNGFFFVDKQIERHDDDSRRLDPQAAERFEPVLREFIASVPAPSPSHGAAAPLLGADTAAALS